MDTAENRQPDGTGGQFVTFWLDGAMYGVPLGEVQEIIRMPPLVHVPLAPPALEGIANLRGTVLPVTSLRTIFARPGCAADDSTRVVVLNRGTLSGFVVDRMASVIATEAGEIEPAADIAGAGAAALLRGMIKRDDGVIMLLDTEQLAAHGSLGGGARQATRLADGGGAASDDGNGNASARAGAAAEQELQLVSFDIAGQEYALPIAEVQEIVQIPANIGCIPRAGAHVLGVMSLRARLLPLVSLRALFSLPAVALDEHHRIIVVALRHAGGTMAVGMVVDAVREVLRVGVSLVDPVPPLLRLDGDARELQAICRLSGGQRLVTILDAARMFAGLDLPAIGAEAALAAEPAEAGHAAEDSETMSAQPDEHTPTPPSTEDGMPPASTTQDEDEQCVVFRLAEEEYGVPIAAVQEIVRVPEAMTRVPRTPDFVEGVINLRGAVLPVIDQRRRFGLPDLGRNDRQRIMVLMVGTVRTGFIVDSVVEVLKIPQSEIGTAPVFAGHHRRLIDRVANLERQSRMLLLLQPDRMLSAAERDALSDAEAPPDAAASGRLAA